MLQRQKNSPIDKLLTCKFWGGAAVKLEPEMIEIYWHFHKISSNILRNTSISMKKKMMMALEHFFVTLFEKSNFCPKIQFWQNANIFTSFLPNFFWHFFSWNQSCQQLKSPKPQHFHEFFTPKNWQFSWEIKVDFFGQKYIPTQNVSGHYNAWSSWSPCSVTCGVGTQTRTRTCWGKDHFTVGVTYCCEGKSKQVVRCKRKDCPDDPLDLSKYELWDCLIKKNSFDSHCSKSSFFVQKFNFDFPRKF